MGKPLLLGSLNITSGGISIYENGFQLRGGDMTGACYNTPTATAFRDFGDPVLNFGEDLVYGC